MVVLVFVLAISVDLGYMFNTRAELQRSADSAALAACWEYYEVLAAGGSEDDADEAARDAAIEYVAANRVCNEAPEIDANWENDAGGDLVIGYLPDLDDGSGSIDVLQSSATNAVRVTVRRRSQMNGEAPLFFARALGRDTLPLNAVGTAALVRHICGFKTPSDGTKLGILPFALDIETWNDMLAGSASDDYTWNTVDQVIESGSDGILEVNLFPQGTGSPGNRGTVDIGSSNNSTNDIARQITDGISEADLAYLGGEIRFNEEGIIILNGDTGISAGVKDELASIIGEPRIIPVYSQVDGPGNNADYTIVQLVGIRIMAVKLTGPMKKKHVTIQPASVIIRGVIPSTPEDSCTQNVFSPVILVQ